MAARSAWAWRGLGVWLAQSLLARAVACGLLLGRSWPIGPGTAAST